MIGGSIALGRARGERGRRRSRGSPGSGSRRRRAAARTPGRGRRARRGSPRRGTRGRRTRPPRTSAGGPGTRRRALPSARPDPSGGGVWANLTIRPASPRGRAASPRHPSRGRPGGFTSSSSSAPPAAAEQEPSRRARPAGPARPARPIGLARSTPIRSPSGSSTQAPTCGDSARTRRSSSDGRALRVEPAVLRSDLVGEGDALVRAAPRTAGACPASRRAGRPRAVRAAAPASRSRRLERSARRAGGRPGRRPSRRPAA